jgi:hypothetical protein
MIYRLFQTILNPGPITCLCDGDSGTAGLAVAVCLSRKKTPLSASQEERYYTGMSMRFMSTLRPLISNSPFIRLFFL